ncbi:hypothetical protein ES703_122267 [subsurface metagenome]
MRRPAVPGVMLPLVGPLQDFHVIHRLTSAAGMFNLFLIFLIFASKSGFFSSARWNRSSVDSRHVSISFGPEVSHSGRSLQSLQAHLSSGVHVGSSSSKYPKVVLNQGHLSQYSLVIIRYVVCFA